MGLFQATVNSQNTQTSIANDPPRGMALLNSIFASVDKPTSSSSAVASSSTTFQQSSSNGMKDYSPNPLFPPPPSVPLSNHFSLDDTQGQYFTPSSYSQGNGGDEPGPFEIHSPKPSMGALPQILNTDVINELLGMAPSRSPSTASSSQSASTNAINETREKGYIADHGEDSEDSMLRDTSKLDLHDARSDRNARPFAPSFLSTGSVPSLKGDVTPRARVSKGLEADSSRDLRHIRTSTPPQTLDQRSTQRGNTTGLHSTPRFQASSDHWPHENINNSIFATIDEYSHARDVNTEQGEEEVLELDFSEIGILSDPDALHPKNSKGKGRLQKSHSSVTVTGNSVPDGLRLNRIASESQAESKKPSGTSSRKQDVTANGIVINVNVTATPTSSNASLPSVSAQAKINGQSKPLLSTQANNPSTDLRGVPDPNWVKDMILGELAQKTLSQPKLNKYDFIREVLSLIHVG